MRAISRRWLSLATASGSAPCNAGPMRRRRRGKIADAPRAASYGLEMLDLYLDLMLEAPPGDATDAKRDREAFGRAMAENAPSARYLPRIIGASAATRISAILRGDPAAELSRTLDRP